MTNPTGFLRSERLERTIDHIAERCLPASGCGKLPPKAGKRQVLHVLTEAAEIGGLTRLVQRWITRDESAVSSVVVTRQHSVLARLAAVVEASGGSSKALGSDRSGLIQRAAELRSIAAGADVVICHLHSDDVVAALAFGEGYHGAPVALYNHADHLFWLAPSRAVAVIDARAVGQSVTVGARGYPLELSCLLPLPVPTRAAGTSKGRRAELGLDDKCVVAVSVARAIKFHDTPLDPPFSSLLAAALENNPQLVICAVGPTPSDSPWPRLAHRFGDRIRVTGPVDDPQPYLRAADFYLDPFPFSSTTSMLEAASESLPTLTLDIHRGFCRVFGLDDFVESPEDRPTTVARYLSRVQVLVQSADARIKGGRAARAGYLARTSEEPWRADLHRLYTRLDTLSKRGCCLGASAPPEGETRIIEHASALLAIEQNIPLLWTVMAGAAGFDRADRARMLPRIMLVRALDKISRLLSPRRPQYSNLLLPRPIRLNTSPIGSRVT